MKCPYRTIRQVNAASIHSSTETVEFLPCMGTECPFYQMEIKRGNYTIPEHCKKVTMDIENAFKEGRKNGP